ncbi:MAG: Glucosyl-3-phosphoglycerate synthase [Firmicutes bacterium]|nr:Glucosyl-3-phosphoglycerate synthase [candidate division NPL-UPA2 bacterium]MBT9153737.1 Glucosyl-3-phosphoglycerate synthase [candidate division NPL-UPA2 bacterium]
MRAAIDCSLVDEVVVVSDGSTDDTASRANGAGARVVVLSPNRGKGGAMLAGFLDSDADVVLFLDADLVGLTTAHVEALLTPVLSGEVASTLGVFGSGRLMTDLAQRIAPFLSGQRAIAREVLRSAPDFANTGWGVEIALTRYLRDSQIAVRIVELRDVTQVMKEEKLGVWRGFASRLRMYWHIFRALMARRRRCQCRYRS